MFLFTTRFLDLNKVKVKKLKPQNRWFSNNERWQWQSFYFFDETAREDVVLSNFNGLIYVTVWLVRSMGSLWSPSPASRSSTAPSSRPTGKSFAGLRWERLLIPLLSLAVTVYLTKMSSFAQHVQKKVGHTCCFYYFMALCKTAFAWAESDSVEVINRQ